MDFAENFRRVCRSNNFSPSYPATDMVRGRRYYSRADSQFEVCCQSL